MMKNNIEARSKELEARTPSHPTQKFLPNIEDMIKVIIYDGKRFKRI